MASRLALRAVKKFLISEREMLKTILVVTLLFSYLEGGEGEGESERTEQDLVEEEAKGGDQRKGEGLMKDQGRREGLQEEGGDDGFARIQRTRRGIEGVVGGGSVMDGRRGYTCTLPLFPCTRYSHKCCHGGSCRFNPEYSNILEYSRCHHDSDNQSIVVEGEYQNISNVIIIVTTITIFQLHII